MKKKIILIHFTTIAFLPGLSAQIGIGTQTPLSTLHNTGSYAGNYVSNPGTTYMLGDDYVVDFTNSTTNTVYTLPSISEGTAANRNGRVYLIRNGSSSSNAVTIQASGTETINTGTTNSNTLLLNSGHSVIIARNANPSGGTSNTWSVVNYGDLAAPSNIVGRNVSTGSGSAVTMTGTNNSPATAVTINRTGGVSPNLLTTNFTVLTPKTVTISFEGALDDGGGDQSSIPYIYFYLEVYDTTTNAVVAGSGVNSALATEMQMLAGQYVVFTLTDDINLPAGTYNVRLKAYYTSSFSTSGLFYFTSYSLEAFYPR